MRKSEMKDDLITKIENVKPEKFREIAIEVLKEIETSVRREYRFYVELYIGNILRRLDEQHYDNVPMIS